jgi:hypothetical protein
MLPKKNRKIRIKKTEKISSWQSITPSTHQRTPRWFSCVDACACVCFHYIFKSVYCCCSGHLPLLSTPNCCIYVYPRSAANKKRWKESNSLFCLFKRVGSCSGRPTAVSSLSTPPLNRSWKILRFQGGKREEINGSPSLFFASSAQRGLLFYFFYYFSSSPAIRHIH